MTNVIHAKFRPKVSIKPGKSAELVDLKAFKRDNTPHITGVCTCLTCKHEWTDTVPVGTTYLECPSCKLVKGVFKHPLIPKHTFHCSVCDSMHYIITPDAVLCAHCATGIASLPIKI